MIEVYTLEESYRGYDVIVKLLWNIDNFTMQNRWFCGYVRLPEDHKFYDAECSEIENAVVVHGGVSLVGEIPGRSGFYVGFDCAHLGDMPEVQDEAYTLDECKRLVDQLIAL